MKNAIYHKPVLLEESLGGLSLKPGGVYVDLTFGGGGHSKELLRRLEGGKLIVFDQDVDAKANLIEDDRLFFVNHNFRYLKNFLRYLKIEQVDGILADLGVSSHEFDESSRGFSYRFDARLDMRMNQSSKLTAYHVVNEYDEAELFRVLKEYGEVKNASKLVRFVVKARAEKPLETTFQLMEVVLASKCEKKEMTFLSKVFQALRIEVNDEIGALKEALEHSLEVLKPGGRLSVISYHSLEDRLVKNFTRTGNFEGKVIKDFYGNVQSPFEILHRKVIVPTEEEIIENSRARSAKLRVVAKK